MRAIGSSLIEPELIDLDAENPDQSLAMAIRARMTRRFAGARYDRIFRRVAETHQRVGDEVPDWSYRLGSPAAGWPSGVVAHARVHTCRC